MIRVRIIRTEGSVPREAGAEMVVSRDSTSGSIGGGQLEYMAIDRARQMLRRGEARAQMDVPLGPMIGQCCGGKAWLLLDRSPPTPEARAGSVLIFGAGHVGRALALALAPLPLRSLLIDSRKAELAMAAPGVETRLTPLPEAELRTAPQGAAVVILTHDHALDFLLGIEALGRPDLSYIGMIGSATKRARFASHARAAGLDPLRLICPIGGKAVADKRPSVIAALTVAEILTRLAAARLTVSPCNI
ncbi:MAG: xanthine dehydrogenase accessory protein XdhC [Paracoccus sp. (in: a-proteobacteria)]|nr:xanthine dehydrogenase accessory protein XdhC [Paracoccus sp. (in: a-proteobacteria)]